MQENLVNMPRTKRGRATLNNILSAAAQVIYEKGYHEASISDITRLAGVATGTFYVYFDGKYSLYKYLLLQCSHKIRSYLSRSIESCTTRLEVERVGMKAWLEFVMENQYMYHIIWESMYVDYHLFEQYYVTFAAAYKKGLDKAKEAGDVGDVDTEVLAYTLMGATNFLGLNWGLFRTDPSQIDYVVDHFVRILEGKAFPASARPENPAPLNKPLPHEPRFRFRVTVDDEPEDEDE